jgi:hypothetical protein
VDVFKERLNKTDIMDLETNREKSEALEWGAAATMRESWDSSDKSRRFMCDGL